MCICRADLSMFSTRCLPDKKRLLDVQLAERLMFEQRLFTVRLVVEIALVIITQKMS